MPHTAAHDTTTAASDAPSSDPTIAVSGVSKVFTTKNATVEALRDVDLEVAPGEIVSIIGRSGCGKSTLLRILSGLLAPTEGSVEINGQPLWHGTTVDTSVNEKLGVVFQEANLLPWFNVVDNIALPLKLLGVDKTTRRQKAADLIDLVGLGGFGHSYPRELSGGMRQRVAIARALSRDPELLLMDEPFGALDALTRERMNLEVQRIVAATKATVVFVTHDIGEAVFLGDRVVQMTPRPGRIEDISPIALARPRSMDMQTTPEFGDHVRHLRHSLEGEL